MSNELRGHLVGIMERAHGGQLPSALDIRELEQYIAERERAARIETVRKLLDHPQAIFSMPPHPYGVKVVTLPYTAFSGALKENKE